MPRLSIALGGVTKTPLHVTVEMVMILLVCILTNEDAYLYKVWLKYLQPDERYGPDKISIHKINKQCNFLKIGTSDMVLGFCSSSDVAPFLYQVS